MKHLNNYILERAKFLVKKHLPHINDIDKDNLTFGDFIKWACDDNDIVNKKNSEIKNALSDAWERVSITHWWHSSSKYILPPFKNQTYLVNFIKNNSDTKIAVEEINSGGSGSYPYLLKINITIDGNNKEISALMKNSFLNEI